MMSASEKHIAHIAGLIAGVQNLVLGMHKALDWHVAGDDRLSTCFVNVAKCVELLWEYRAVDRTGVPELWFVRCEFGWVAQGKGEWFEKDLTSDAALIIIRDQVQPLVEAARKDALLFKNVYLRDRLDGLHVYVVHVGRAIEAGWAEPALQWNGWGYEST